MRRWSDNLLSPDGKPMPEGIGIRLENNETGEVYESSTAKRGGVFVVELPPGTYSLRVAPTKYGPWGEVFDTDYVIPEFGTAFDGR